MVVYRLHYFDFAGRAEIARLLFHGAEREFDDVRYTEKEWAEFKPKTPFGVLPVLEIDGKMFGESHAIYNYLAKQFGFYGNNNLEQLEIDVVMSLMKEMEPFILEAFFETPDEKKKEELITRGFKENIPAYLRKNEKIMQDSGYFVGDKLSLADIAVYDLTNFFMRRDPNLMTPYPKLSASRKLIETYPGIAAYIKSRQK
ncbi:hypothetical protein LOTGIDRAFT_134409 [Lottia gigantea]|uniref:Glutathione transferase n=1 Tax=Lottia gigantea TaxID=225164 RepID=V3ZEP9_LOTGI|nr:hypothetical protein LOTGIDRAFT_134409 [Lottia gigantea]ESO82572.1 hypothetical protein LOTGIDRAFT_134409 [Lottia gigantea]